MNTKKVSYKYGKYTIESVGYVGEEKVILSSYFRRYI